MIKNIIIKTRFEAIHNWPECPYRQVEYLKNPHRHIFHIVMKWHVAHNDRDKEFIMVKHTVEEFISKNWAGKWIGRQSCEDIAEKLLIEFDAAFVSVFEDNENGVEICTTS